MHNIVSISFSTVNKGDFFLALGQWTPNGICKERNYSHSIQSFKTFFHENEKIILNFQEIKPKRDKLERFIVNHQPWRSLQQSSKIRRKMCIRDSDSQKSYQYYLKSSPILWSYWKDLENVHRCILMVYNNKNMKGEVACLQIQS